MIGTKNINRGIGGQLVEVNALKTVGDYNYNWRL
jgi:hypothetical protein